MFAAVPAAFRKRDAAKSEMVTTSMNALRLSPSPSPSPSSSLFSSLLPVGPVHNPNLPVMALSYEKRRGGGKKEERWRWRMEMEMERRGGR
ncbi:MAG: hypothetical protein GY856_32075 [bacterium]|nr:hypothetical protein [bacterium]